MPRADVAHERLAIAAIESLKGTATLDKTLHPDARVAAKFETLNDADRGLVQLKALSKLEELNLAGTKITDVGVISLKDVSTLKLLKLTRTGATEKGISALEAALPKLNVRR